MTGGMKTNQDCTCACLGCSLGKGGGRQRQHPSELSQGVPRRQQVPSARAADVPTTLSVQQMHMPHTSKTTMGSGDHPQEGRQGDCKTSFKVESPAILDSR